MRMTGDRVYEALATMIPNLPPAGQVKSVVLTLNAYDAPTLTIRMYPDDLDPEGLVERFAIVSEADYNLLQSIDPEKEI